LLSLQTSSEKVIAEYPLEWDGGTAALTVDGALGNLEWGTSLAIALTPVDGDDVYLGVRFESRNRSERPNQEVFPITGPNGAIAYWAGTIEPGEARRFRVGMRHFPDLDTTHLEIALDGGEPRRVLSKHPIRPPPPGPLRLRVINRPVQPDSVADLQVFAETGGGEREPPPHPAETVPRQRADGEEEVAAAAAEAEHQGLGAARTWLRTRTRTVLSPGPIRGPGRCRARSPRTWTHFPVLNTFSPGVPGADQLIPTSQPRREGEREHIHGRSETARGTDQRRRSASDPLGHL
jgi:hypothetical protein